MLLTVLGASPATQNPGGACSSYLVRQGATSILLDLGSGAFANLQRHAEPDAVDAVIISHTHADHMLDLVPYRYWLAFASASRRPRLLLPPGGHDTILAVSGLQDKSPTFYSDVFDVAEYEPSDTLSLGGLRIEFQLMRHAPHTYGMRVSGGGGALAYSADSGPCDGVRAVARDADLFLCENANTANADNDIHLTPDQAGTFAQDAAARRLLLTHRWHVLGLDTALREAADVFVGPVSIAREGDSYAIGG